MIKAGSIAEPNELGEIIQPTGLTALHSLERREIAIRLVSAHRGPLTVLIPQLAVTELIRMLGAELDKLGPLPGETIGPPRQQN